MSDETIILRLSPLVLGRDASPAPPDPTGRTSYHESLTKIPNNHETVSGFVLDAVAETCQQGPNLIIEVKNRPSLPGKSMVGTMVYCYTKGVLSAAEIEQSLWKDDLLRGKCSEKIPTARTISRFRRLNRGLIQACLENALRRIRRALASSTLSQSLTCGGADTNPKPARLFNVAPAPGEGTTILIRKEAAQRVENATYLDSELVNE